MPLPWNEGTTGNSKAELPELASDASPLELGDWLAVCGPVLRDISQVSARWWNLTLREAQCFYDRWKTSSPLERVQINPRLPDELLDGRYQRTEQRGVNLLLRSIPSDQQQALITARELTSTALLFRLFVRYQPGGAGEKAILLSKLTVLDKSKNSTELAAALRSWRRHFARAEEIDAVLPDGTLLLKALEPACTVIAGLDAQASFRLAQSRLQLGVDQLPQHQGVWRFSQCLLAEAETLSLQSSTPSVTSSPIKVKQMEATSKPSVHGSGPSDKGKGHWATSTPCKYFRSDAGCKAGRSCRWSHSWDGVDDKNSRCWICGGKDHRKSDCKLKSQSTKGKEQKTSGEPMNGSGGGKGSSSSSATTASQGSGLSAAAAKSTGASSMSTPPKMQEMDASGEVGTTTQESETSVGEVNSKGSGETGSTTSEVLLQEATKLLKSLRGPQLRVIKVSQLDYEHGNTMVLLDSGATHALRPAFNDAEWDEAQPTQVSLADGVTTKLRLKPNSKVLLSSPYDEANSQSWIVPMGGVAELGYKFGWKGARCWLCDDRGQDLEVSVHHGCPMVSRAVGQDLISKLETRQVLFAMKTMLVNALFADPQSVNVANVQHDLELALTVKLKVLFPALPDEILMRVVPSMTDSQEGIDGALLPWNRRKRRRLAQAKQVVVHLFSGPDQRFWEKKLSTGGMEVLCVDISANIAADLHDDHVFRYLLTLSASGRVKAVLPG